MELTAIGYTRVSTDDQANFGNGLYAQQQAINLACERRGWHLAEMVTDDGLSGKTLERPGLQRALNMIASGQADALVVAKLDRLSRSVVDFGTLLEWFAAAEGVLLALDLDVDTSSPGGRLVANVFASVAEWERETIAARTRDGLAAIRAQGRPIGPPAVRDVPGLTERIQTMREQGMSFRAICKVLNDERVPTPRGGGEWRPSSIQATLGYVRRQPMRKAPELPELPARRRR